MYTMTNNENAVKSSDVSTPKKTTVKKNIKEKQDIQTNVENQLNSLVVYFQSGTKYVMANGVTFDQVNKMHELPFMDANLLLRLENFRLANDEEKQMYYNTMEG